MVNEMLRQFLFLSFFFFNDTATTEIYTLSLHDALPISPRPNRRPAPGNSALLRTVGGGRSEEHTSELQSHSDLVCRLLLEKKKRSINRLIQSMQPVMLYAIRKRMHVFNNLSRS